MSRREWRSRMPWLIILPVIVAVLLAAGPLPAEELNQGGPPRVDPLWIYLTIFILVAVFGGVIAFLFVLQRTYLNACVRDNQLNLFSRSALGLPAGTVRAVITFIIIAISLYLYVLLFFRVPGPENRFPEALSSLFGAVVGFYFGSKTGGGSSDSAQEEIENLKRERDSAKSDSVLSKLRKGIDMTNAVIHVLPEEQRKKSGDMAARLEQGYFAVQTLASGGIKDAAAKGHELFDLFRKDNPARDAFAAALKSFGPVLGGTMPALAVISTVVGAGVKLVGHAYEKWKKRILNAPITPAMLPLKDIDANTGFTLLLQCPIFKTVFTKELEGNDRAFMTKAAELLTRENVEDFRTTYKERFLSREHFAQGLQEFRRAGLDRELAAETMDDPSLFAQAGGLKAFLQSLDRINGNEEAQASLHQLATIVEELRRQGEPVPAIFEKVRKEEGL